MKNFLAVFVALIAGSAYALESSVDLRLEVQGIENCHNKCDKVFDRLQYAISDQPNANTFEFRSCILGCNRCQRQLRNQDLEDDTCFNYCKTYNYAGDDIRKGVIEPDKACIMGCIINTCQEICWGGTTDHAITPRNQGAFWGMGGHGCAIKGGLGYVQAPNYGNPDAPAGQGGVQQDLCCTNAFNVCFYVGNKDSTNYRNVVRVTQDSCRPFIRDLSEAGICRFYNNKQNCGTVGMAPGVVAGN